MRADPGLARSLSGGAARSRTGSLARRRICNPPRYRPVPAPCCPRLDGGARGRSAGFRAGPRPFPYLPRPARTGGRQLPRPDPSSPAYRHLRSSAPLWLSYPEPHDGGQLDAPCSACRSVADGPGFEPGRPFRAWPLSRGLVSTTHPPVLMRSSMYPETRKGLFSAS